MVVVISSSCQFGLSFLVGNFSIKYRNVDGPNTRRRYSVDGKNAVGIFVARHSGEAAGKAMHAGGEGRRRGGEVAEVVVTSSFFVFMKQILRFRDKGEEPLNTCSQPHCSTNC